MGLNGFSGKSAPSHCQRAARGTKCSGLVEVGAQHVVGESPSGTERETASNGSFTPENADEIVELIERCGDGALIIGGGTYFQSLDVRGPLSELMLTDIRRLGPDAAESDSEGSEIGATIRSAALVHGDAGHSDLWLGAVRYAAMQVPLRIRHTVTVGGCVAVASPFFDLPVAYMTRDDVVGASGRGGLRRISLGDFSTRLFENYVERGQFLAELRLPQVPPRFASALVKVASAASGQGLDRDTLTTTGKARASDVEPLSAHRASSRYRKVLAGVLVRRGFESRVARECLEEDRA